MGSILHKGVAMKRAINICCAAFCITALMLPLSLRAQQSPPQAGTYATEGGWGHLVIGAAGAKGIKPFSLDTENAGSGCTFSGRLNPGGVAVVYEGDAPSQCSLNLTIATKGLMVSTSTKEQCREYCGSNGSFEGDYHYVPAFCAQPELDKTRRAFKKLYDEKRYTQAESILAPIYRECLSTVGMMDEGGLRNDYALTQYKLKDKAGCLATLSKYRQDAARPDDAITQNISPAVVDDYLSVIHAARTNIALCLK
ncbi:hypothetical protein PSCICN_20800 [Pseudomonas cichorii]|uniref:hypothetical protein n=1 Tax=Pseudomonas cichorii TaxID=36746 RepID=UPI00190FE296|nr:hypothetical protein [Pseudomonas cichorii]GFM81388.1 hypothetical protein PSCICN_20800 [Pseudomonas cichorii]